MTKISFVAALLLLLPAGAAFAQAGTGDSSGSTNNPNGPRKPPSNLPPEIVHGFYAEFDFGIMKMLGGDAGSLAQPGVMAGFAIGTDIGENFKIEGRMLNSTMDGNANVFEVPNATQQQQSQAPCTNGAPSGTACVNWPDIQVSLVTADVKAALPLSERVNAHLLLGGGVMLSNPAPSQLSKFNASTALNSPASVASGNTPVFGGGIGMEYYTHMRHFSVGADVAGWVGGGSTVITVFPTIKYSF